MSKDWYSIAEVAAMLGETYKKIYNLLDAGELGCYRVGRSYRIRKTDLEDYFARQGKQLAPLLVEAEDEATAVILDLVETPVVRTEPASNPTAALQAGSRVDKQSPAGAAPGGTLPQAWSVPASAVRPLPMIAMTDAHATPLAQLGSREETALLVTGHVAYQAETAYLANFQALFARGIAVTHPTTGENIRPDDWSALSQAENELVQLSRLLSVSILREAQRTSYPNNVRFQYWVEPRSLGGIFRKFPKHGLVIECATVARLERFVRTGYDKEPLGQAELDRELRQRQEEIERPPLRGDFPVAYLVGLASPTGWDAVSKAQVRSRASEAQLIVYLIDLANLAVYCSQADGQSSRYLEIFELALGEGKLVEVERQIEESVLAAGAISLGELHTRIGCSVGLLREACLHLARTNAEYRVLTAGDSFVIRHM